MKLYQIDAFAEKAFTGNPAAIVPLDEFLPDKVMQDIALENNLAETAYIVKSGDEYKIRWFTPTVEVDLCGHATLASAHVLFVEEQVAGTTLRFDTRSGELVAERGDDGWITL